MSIKSLVCATFLAMIGVGGASRGVHYGDTLDGQASKAGYEAFIADRSGQIHGRFNESSCSECHNVPATGGSQFLRQDFVIKRAGPDGKAVTFSRYAMVRGIVTFRYPRGTYELRRPQPLFGAGLLEAVSREELQRVAADERARAPRHAGRLAVLCDGSVGRFGWKAAVPTLHAFVQTAFATEVGVPKSRDIEPVTHYLRMLAAPPRGGNDVPQGRALFASIGCADCHRPALRSSVTIDAYTDLLLHDMGTRNAGFAEGAASAAEYRTPPLWGIARTGPPYLHNGRADSLAQAIELHGGQAADSAAAFRALSIPDRSALLRFLHSL